MSFTGLVLTFLSLILDTTSFVLPLWPFTRRCAGRPPWTEPGEATTITSTSPASRFYPSTLDFPWCVPEKRPGKARPPWIPGTKPGVRRPTGLPVVFRCPKTQKKHQLRKTRPPPNLKNPSISLSGRPPYKTPAPSHRSASGDHVGRWHALPTRRHGWAVCAFCLLRATDRGSWRAK